MSTNINMIAIATAAMTVIASCGVAPEAEDLGARKGSRISSITMPIPDRLKAYVAPDKINAFNLSIEPGTCDQGVTGTTITKVAGKIDGSGPTLANEKIRQACSYTLILSLGKVDATGTKLEKVYLTNDIEGRRTEIPIEKTRVSKIQVTTLLYVTADGQKDLMIEGQTVPVPTITESDAEIGVDIAQDGSQTPQSGQPSADYDYRKDIVFTDVASYAFSGTDYGSVFYKDVMTHTPAGERDFQTGPSTHAHETLHGLHNAMRNRTRQKDAFFYLENGKGSYVIEPIENSRDVKNHIGASFRQLSASRYNLYLVEQARSWTNTLYFFDEWNAYVGTTRSAVEIQRAGRWNPADNADPIEGLVDFMYYCSASILSIKNVDPQYLATNKQFKATYAMIMEESVKWMNEARKESIWSGSKAWIKMQNFQTAADGANVRKAIKDLMGDAWTKRVLSF
jgi:hypothetical protein